MWCLLCAGNRASRRDRRRATSHLPYPRSLQYGRLRRGGCSTRHHAMTSLITSERSETTSEKGEFEFFSSITRSWSLTPYSPSWCVLANIKESATLCGMSYSHLSRLFLFPLFRVSLLVRATPPILSNRILIYSMASSHLRTSQVVMR